ncbi:MAG: transcriptional regulator [Candidatus Ranarchaeia archaeon]
MTKDKAYGALIFLVSIFIIAYYTYWAVIIEIIPDIALIPILNLIPLLQSKWATILPVWIAMVGIFSIAAWVGWTMLTTPPPTPIDETEESMD